MDANSKEFDSLFEYVLKEGFGMPGQNEKKKSIRKPSDYEANYLFYFNNLILNNFI